MCGFCGLTGVVTAVDKEDIIRTLGGTFEGREYDKPSVNMSPCQCTLCKAVREAVEARDKGCKWDCPPDDCQCCD